MNKIPLLLVILTVSITGCLNSQPNNQELQDISGIKIVGTEKLDNNAEILKISLNDSYPESARYSYRIKYNDGGKEIEFYFHNNTRGSLDWIRENLPSDAVILSWWDYGHTIRGYADRKVVAKAPSPNILQYVVFNGSILDPDDLEEAIRIHEELSSDETITDIARFLLEPNLSGNAGRISDKYGAKYLFVNKEKSYLEQPHDLLFLRVLTTLVWNSTMDIDDFWDRNQQRMEYPDEITNTILYKSTNGQFIEGLRLMYTDDYVNLYEMIE